MNTKPQYTAIPPEEAIPLWNQLASINPTNLTHAHNPSLFTFYTQYLKLSAYYFILYAHGQPIALLPLTSQRPKANRQPPTANSQQPTANSQQPTANSQQPTANSQQPTANSQQLFSLPHLSYGGIHWLSKPSFNVSEIYCTILEQIKKSTLAPGFYQVHLNKPLRTRPSLAKLNFRSLHQELPYTVSNKSTYWLKLHKTESEQLAQFTSNLRRKIRAASRKEVTVILGREELLSEFIPIYQRNMHRLGSPALAKAFFKHMIQACKKEEATIAIAYFEGKPIGGGLWLSYAGFCENSVFATLAKHNHLYTSYALHWAMIQHAQGRGDHTYSFGRSTTNSTVAHYKTQWPVQILPLYHNSTHPIKKNHHTRNLLTLIWKYLPPFLVNTLGPHIAKRIY